MAPVLRVLGHRGSQFCPKPTGEMTIVLYNWQVLLEDIIPGWGVEGGGKESSEMP